jgi:hypothetical protein
MFLMPNARLFAHVNFTQSIQQMAQHYVALSIAVGAREHAIAAKRCTAL